MLKLKIGDNMINFLHSLIIVVAGAIAIAGMIPAAINYLAFVFVIPIVVEFYLLHRTSVTYGGYELKNNITKIVIFKILSFLSFLVIVLTKGGIKGLTQSYYSLAFSSIFILISLIYWVKFFLSLSRIKRELYQVQQQNNTEINEQQETSTTNN